MFRMKSSPEKEEDSQGSECQKNICSVKRGEIKTIREIRIFIRWRTEVEDTKRNATQNDYDDFEQKAIFEVFYIE